MEILPAAQSPRSMGNHWRENDLGSVLVMVGSLADPVRIYIFSVVSGPSLPIVALIDLLVLVLSRSASHSLILLRVCVCSFFLFVTEKDDF